MTRDHQASISFIIKCDRQKSNTYITSQVKLKEGLGNQTVVSCVDMIISDLFDLFDCKFYF